MSDVWRTPGRHCTPATVVPKPGSSPRAIRVTSEALAMAPGGTGLPLAPSWTPGAAGAAPGAPVASAPAEAVAAGVAAPLSGPPAPAAAPGAAAPATAAFGDTVGATAVSTTRPAAAA